MAITAFTPCDCLLAISGVPDQWSVVMSGVTNTMFCNTCTNANATYVLTHPALVPDPCVWTTAFSVCGFTPTVTLTVSQNADGTTNLKVEFGGGGSFATYSLSNLVGDLAGTYTLNKTGGTGNCNLPSTITATAVTPAFATLKQNSQTDLDCYAAISRGFAPGSPLRALHPIYFGPPLRPKADGGGGRGPAGAGAASPAAAAAGAAGWNGGALPALHRRSAAVWAGGALPALHRRAPPESGPLLPTGVTAATTCGAGGTCPADD